MTNALSIPGKIQVTAEIEHRTSQYGTPRPRMVLKVLGDCHYKVALAVAHQVAAQLELALIEAGLDTLVEMGDGVSELYEGRRQIGHRTTVELELVGDSRRMKGDVEQPLAERALQSVADRINAASRG